MVGRMFREAVENLIDDVKESIEEQGRTSAHRRRPPPRPPIPNLELPPNLEVRHGREVPANLPQPTMSSQTVPPSTASGGAAPAAGAPVVPVAGPAPAPIATVHVTPPTDVRPDDPDDDVTVDDRSQEDQPAAPAVPPSAPERAAASLTRLEADCEAARELYRETRAELREARRLARLAARDERRDRRYERRSRSEVDEVD